MRNVSEIAKGRRPLRLRDWGWIQTIAQRLAALDVSPNTVSYGGVTVSALSGAAFYLTGTLGGIERLLWLMGGLLILVRILANTVDGLMAVEFGRATPVGKLYNEAPDRVSDALILVGAGYADGGSIVFGYLAACVALFVAYVRTLAETAGAPGDFRGPMAKGHRMVTVFITAVLMTVSPATWLVRWGPEGEWGLMAIALLLVILGGVVTALRRLQSAAAYLKRTP